MTCHLISKNHSFHFTFKSPKLYEVGKLGEELNFVLHETHLMVQLCEAAFRTRLTLAPGRFSSAHVRRSSVQPVLSQPA